MNIYPLSGFHTEGGPGIPPPENLKMHSLRVCICCKLMHDAVAVPHKLLPPPPPPTKKSCMKRCLCKFPLQFSCLLLQTGMLQGFQCRYLCHHIPGKCSPDTGDTHHDLTLPWFPPLSAAGTCMYSNHKVIYNTTQCNSPKTVIFKEKWAAASGGTRTRNILCSRQMLYQLSYRGSSAGWVESHIQSNATQGKASQPEDQT